jgi:hypothetical protein
MTGTAFRSRNPVALVATRRSQTFWVRPARARGLLALRKLLKKNGETLGHRLRKSVVFVSEALSYRLHDCGNAS